ncbi:MAG: hypothetical protein WD038_11260 [Balneolales bacterium]
MFLSKITAAIDVEAVPERKRLLHKASTLHEKINARGVRASRAGQEERAGSPSGFSNSQ